MGTSDDALAALEKAAAQVLKCAEATHGGVGLACFATCAEQTAAFAKAKAKEDAAKDIVATVADFKAKHGSFK